MNPQTYNELVTSHKMYDLITERLQKPSDSKVMGTSTQPDFNHELVQMILELYDNDSEFCLQDMHQFSLQDILQYIQASHHYYLSKKVPEIEQSLLHIIHKFGATHHVLVKLALFFNSYKDDLIKHFKMEDHHTFPYIARLIKAANNELPPEEIKLLLSLSVLDKFDEAHDPIEDELKKVSELLALYGNEPDTPLAFKVFLNQVEIFELELRKHAIIEDHVLIPMARELEQKLRMEYLTS